MKSLLYIPLIIFTFFACSKAEMRTNKIDGDWQLIHVKFYDTEGILHLPTCEGELNTSKINDSQLSYTQNLSFNLQGNDVEDICTGTFNIIEKGAKIETTITTIDTNYTSIYNIIMITKTDFGIELFDLNGHKRIYTFRKK